MYSLVKSNKKVKDLNEGDLVVVYAKGLPHQTKFSIVEYDKIEYVFSKTDKIRQWVYYDGEGRYKTVEQLRQECFDGCEDDETLDACLVNIEYLDIEPLDLAEENAVVWLHTSDVDLYELNGMLYLLADELNDDVCVINI